jgi:YidC/Oxa1 family membrane protein insertase
MEKRTILAIVLSLAVLLGFQYFFPPAQPPKPAAVSGKGAAPAAKPLSTDTTAKATQPAADAKAVKKPAAAPAPVAEIEEGELVFVETTLYRAEIDTLGGRLKSFYLKEYKTENTPDSPELNLVTVTGNGLYPLTGAVKIADKWLPDARLRFQPPAAGKQLQIDEKHRTLRLEARLPEGGRLIKEFHFEPATYVVGVDYTAIDKSGNELPIAAVRLNWSHSSAGQKKSRYVYNGIIGYINDKLFKPGKKDKEVARQELIGKINWLGYTSKYFLSALLVPEKGAPGATRGIISRNDADNLMVTFEAGGSSRLRAYIGPKSSELLKPLQLHLEDSIEYGWFGIIARPLVSLLHFLYQYIHNYGVAIIILTILIKLAFYPLSQKSYKSMSQMKKVQPKLAKLKEKHKDDKARLNKEMMDLYRTHKVNPFGGCLPMLVQIPVFFALYRALMVAIELRHAPFVFWITDLSAKDPYYVTPLIMGATMFLQQKMTPSTGDAMQAKMMLFMPIIFTFMFLNFPSGLVLYWLVNNILSIGQQYLVMRQVEA